MTIRIALCNQDPKALSVIAGAAEALFADRGLPVYIHRFQNCEDMLLSLEENRYQLVLTDIALPGMDGIAAAKQIREHYPETQIVFVSGCESRVFEALTARPLGFVRKSNFLEDMTAVVNLVADELLCKGFVAQVSFHTRSSVVELESRKIRYIEGNRNYQLVYITGRSEPMEVKMTMDKLELVMEPYGFMRIHKGYLVNYRHISRITYDRVILDDGTALPVGRSKASEIKSRFLLLMKK